MRLSARYCYVFICLVFPACSILTSRDDKSSTKKGLDETKSKVADAPFKYFRADYKKHTNGEVCQLAGEQKKIAPSNEKWNDRLKVACQESSLAKDVCNGASESKCLANRHICSVIQESSNCGEGPCPALEPPFLKCSELGQVAAIQDLLRDSLCLSGPVVGEVLSGGDNGYFCSCPGRSEYRNGFGCVAHEALCADSGGQYMAAGSSCSKKDGACDLESGERQFAACECPEGVSGIGGRYCAANPLGGDVYWPGGRSPF